MRQYLRVIVLLLVSGTVFCTWDTPKLLAEGMADTIPSIYVDESASLTYAFYGYFTYNDSNMVTYFCFQTLTTDEKLSDRQCIRQKRKVLTLSVAGEGDGKTLYIVFTGTRKKGGVECARNNTDGCVDAYFTQSTDAGKTWTEPVPMPREDMADIAYRHESKIVFLKESGRLFVVTRLRPISDSFAIAYSTRPQGSMIFTNEKKFSLSGSYEFTNILLSYTANSGNPMIHVTCLSYPSLLYKNTSNLGATWDNLPLRSPYSRCAYSMSPSSNSDNVYIVSLFESNAFAIHWRHPSDIHWHMRELTFAELERQYRPVVIGLAKENSKLLFTGKLKVGNLSTFIYDVEWEELTDLNDIPPVSPYPQGVSIADKETTKFRVMHNISSNLYLSTYTYIPTSIRTTKQ